MKILIVGRTGSGKSYLASLLEEKGLKQLRSYATRAPRGADDNTHIFIAKEEAASMKNRVAEPKISEYEYFATKQQLEECDVYVIDPNGVEALVNNVTDMEFWVVNLRADETARQEAAIRRVKDTKRERTIFHDRNEKEKARFDQFESMIDNGTERICYPNISRWIVGYNDYSGASMKSLVDMLTGRNNKK